MLHFCIFPLKPHSCCLQCSKKPSMCLSMAFHGFHWKYSSCHCVGPSCSHVTQCGPSPITQPETQKGYWVIFLTWSLLSNVFWAAIEVFLSCMWFASSDVTIPGLVLPTVWHRSSKLTAASVEAFLLPVISWMFPVAKNVVRFYTLLLMCTNKCVMQGRNYFCYLYLLSCGGLVTFQRLA